MSCLIWLTLQNPAKELEHPQHPLHETWFKSLRLLRDISRKSQRGARNRCYCGVDQENPQHAFILYEKCTEEEFRTITAICTSKGSKINRILAPLLMKPLHSDSIQRLPSGFDLRKHFGHSTLNLEFITLYNPQRSIWLIPWLSEYAPKGSQADLHEVPVNSVTQNELKLSNGDVMDFMSIEWKIFERREEVLADPWLTGAMRVSPFQKEFRPRILRELGRVEEELTWEEDLQVYIACAGADRVQTQMVVATALTDEFLGLPQKRGMGKVFQCVIV